MDLFKRFYTEKTSELRRADKGDPKYMRKHLEDVLKNHIWPVCDIVNLCSPKVIVYSYNKSLNFNRLAPVMLRSILPPLVIKIPLSFRSWLDQNHSWLTT